MAHTQSGLAGFGDDRAHPRGAWRASPSRALSGRVTPPGDKSISHRAFLLGAVADGETNAVGVLESEDVLATAQAVRALGAEVARTGPGVWRIAGVGALGLTAPAEPLDFGNSGTGCRLTMGLVAGHPLEARFIGDASLSARPMGRVLKPLRAMGAVAHDTDGRLPAMVRGRPPLREIAWISQTASAQVKSAVLLAGLAADGAVEFVEPRASRDHTERMLRQFGVEVDSESDGDRCWRRLVGPADLTGCDVTVPADPSSAAFLTAAAMVCPDSEVTVEGVLANPTRVGFFETAFDMGARLDFEDTPTDGAEPIATIVAHASALTGVDALTERAPSMIDEYPILAVCAAFAEGRTVLRGAGELRVKESDRIAATAALLRAGGVTVEEFDDGLAVDGLGAGGPPGGGLVETHGDHRIAMAALVLGLGAQAPMTIDDAAMIATSYPTFFDDMRALGADLTPVETAT